LKTPDPFLDADEIRAASFVRHIEVHDTLASTNDRAAELASDPQVELPALVVARRQTAGRGRGHNAWWSADGALTFSLLVDATALGISTRSWPQFSLSTAVAVCDALSKIVSDCNHQAEAAKTAAALRVGIKWPNDVMLDGGKVCGILIESPGGRAPAKDRLIVGIGINVNNSWRSAPREAGSRGIALCDSTLAIHRLQDVLTVSLQAIQQRLEQLAANGRELPAAWRRLCWLTEQRVEANTNRNWIHGICAGIDVDGTLLIEDVFGTHRIHSGSVHVV
jgi:BirA family biotin operon repressor/biotin-[acetyl-CoA-carboxylase] ligase